MYYFANKMYDIYSLHILLMAANILTEEQIIKAQLNNGY